MTDNNDFDMEKTQMMGTPDPGTGDAPKAKVRPKEKALKLVCKELAKKGVRYTGNEVEDVIDALYSAYEDEGTVPTREAFAETCPNPEAGGTVLGMERDPFTVKPLGKKGIAAICAGCVLAAALVGGGIWWAAGSQPQGSPDTGSTVVETGKADSDDKDGKDEVDKVSDDKEVGEDADSEKDDSSDTAAEGGSGKDQSGNGASSSSGGSGSGTSSEPSSGSTGSSGGSANNGSNSSGGSGNSSSGNSGSGKDQHTHNWVAQTTTVHHDAVYTTEHHDAVTKDVCICNGCGASFDSYNDWGAHSESQLLSGNYNCGSYYPSSVIVQGAWDEQVLVSNAWDETVPNGYKCSGCGATK